MGPRSPSSASDGVSQLDLDGSSTPLAAVVSRNRSSIPEEGNCNVSSVDRVQGKVLSATHDSSGPMLELIFPGNSEMARRMRALDWSRTPLGAVETWPESLKSTVRLCLGSRSPMVIWWGRREFTQLYNDAYISFLGSKKHPEFLGRSGKECWNEIWPTMGPMWETVFATGEATWSEDFLYVLNRNIPREEGYFTFSYSPLRDDEGKINGIFCSCYETTERVVGERRLRTLRDLGRTVAAVKSPEEACEAAVKILAGNRADIPFALIYLLDKSEESAILIATDGISAGSKAAPSSISLNARGNDTWPLRRARETCSAEVVHDLPAVFGPLPGGLWPESAETGLVLPFASPGQLRPSGFLVAGLSLRRVIDADYLSFFDLIAGHIGTAVANARAYEEERKRAESLAELDRAKTLFFSNISHELRTPLTLLLGPTESVLSSEDGALKGADLEMVHRNELRMLKLVNTLLDFSRIEAGRVQAIYEPTDLSSLTADIASAFRSAMEKAGLGFTVECERSNEPVYVDREMWEKIVLNLLSNAFKFTFEGEVALSLRSADGSVDLTVRDTGVGIPRAELPRVFERFHRIETIRARTHEGTGIGLALVQELARLHGGRVSVESEEGRGSTFRVTIPKGTAHLAAEQIGKMPTRTLSSTALRADTYIEEALRWIPRESGLVAVEEPPAMLPSLMPTDPGREKEDRETVLIVDDNADMRDYLSRLLSPTYNVHTAVDGFDALEAAQRIRPDLILTDIMMPRLDGFGVLRAVRADAEIGRTPVIMVSARAGEESQVEGLDAGADDYLVKPFTAREMLARISTHIRIARVRDEAGKREARLRAAAELAQLRLEEMLAQIPAAVGLLRGPEHRWTYVNEGYVRVTGRKDRSDFIGKTVGESLPEIETQGVVQLLDRVYQTGAPYLGRDYKVLLNRGWGGQAEEVYFDFVYTPFRDAQGDMKGILVHAIEVTDKIAAKKLLEEQQKKLQESLAASRQLAAIVESSDAAIISKDLGGTVTSWNQCAERIFGYSAEEMVGQPITKIIPPELQDEEEKILATIARGEGISHFETERLTKDGRRIDVSLTISPIRDESGAIVGASKIARDITETKQKDQLLRTTERLASVGRLAATIAHEINNPLEAATNLIYLARTASDLKQVEAFLAQADEELRRVALLSRQTLGFYRETRGATGFRIGRVVDSLITALSSKARNKAITVKWELRKDAEVYAIESEVRQLVANLLNNSIEATRQGGTVWVRVSPGRSWMDDSVTGARITIADSGPGIEARHRARLFEPFFTTKREVGTGLGLWITKGIVDRHGGSIRFRSSVEEGRSGTAFMVFLPDKARKVAASEEKIAQSDLKLSA